MDKALVSCKKLSRNSDGIGHTRKSQDDILVSVPLTLSPHLNVFVKKQNPGYSGYSKDILRDGIILPNIYSDQDMVFITNLIPPL